MGTNGLFAEAFEIFTPGWQIVVSTCYDLVKTAMCIQYLLSSYDMPGT